MKIYTPENSQDVFQSNTREILSELVGAGIEGTASKYSIAHVKVMPGGLTPKHYHPEVEETYCIIKGRGLMTLGGEEAEVGPGDVIHINPPKHHKMVNSFEENLEMIVICAPSWTPDCTVWLEQWQDGGLVSLQS